MLFAISCAELEAIPNINASEPELNEKLMRWVDPSPTPLTCSPEAQEESSNGVHDMGSNPHFEGWYYRFTHPRTDESWVLITAYWLDDEGEGHGFLKLIHGPHGDSYTETLTNVDVASIHANKGYFSVQLGSLWFSADGVVGTLKADSGEEVELDLAIEGCARWGAPFDEGNRWTMGWATNAPGVPLRWHVHHLKAESRGTIRTYYGEWALDEYTVHQEKNWGQAFPTSWIWFQANQFVDRPDVAFAAAGPIFPNRFSPNGYMAGLRINDEFYTWRSQDAHIFPDVEFQVDHAEQLARWRFVGESIRSKIEVDVEVPLSELIPIAVPTNSGLEIGAVEHLAADLKLKLYRRSVLGWEEVEVVRSLSAAVEVGGDWARSKQLIP